MKKTLRNFLKIPRYTAKVIRKVKNRPGEWDSLKVGIFQDKKQIGSYVRNYHNLSKTFFPFEHKGKWYALFSREYTRTEIMVLPTCEIIGSEPPVKGEGFCPVEFYVPNYIQVKFADGTGKREWCYDPLIDVDKWKLDPAKGNEYEFHYFDVGFVAGCIWGDDWSWKVQHLDLSQIEKGVITRSEKFGYVSLGRNCSLENSVDMIMFDPNAYRILLAISKCYYVNPDEAKDYSKYTTDD